MGLFGCVLFPPFLKYQCKFTVQCTVHCIVQCVCSSIRKAVVRDLNYAQSPIGKIRLMYSYGLCCPHYIMVSNSPSNLPMVYTSGCHMSSRTLLSSPLDASLWLLWSRTFFAAFCPLDPFPPGLLAGHVAGLCCCAA